MTETYKIGPVNVASDGEQWVLGADLEHKTLLCLTCGFLAINGFVVSCIDGVDAGFIGVTATNKNHSDPDQVIRNAIDSAQSAINSYGSN